MSEKPKLQAVPDREETLEEMRQRLRAEDERREAQERLQARIQRAHEASGVPPRYQGATLAGFQIRNEQDRRAVAAVGEYAERFEELAKVGRCLILIGPIGVGKTHLGTALVRALCDQGRRAGYARLGDLIRRIRDTWRKDARESELDVLAWTRRLDLLVLDELGVQYGTESEKNHLFDVIDGRYMDLKPTIVLSNCRPEELKDYLGERAMDRLRENGGRMLRLEGASFRAKAKEGGS